MKINDKVLVAFLVAAGMFSLLQASQYVKTLSAKEKRALLSVQKVVPQVKMVCESPDIQFTGNNKKTA